MNHSNSSQPSTAPVSLPSISAVLPTYNQAGYIRQALDSVLMQNYPNLEIIVDRKSVV